MAGQKQPIFIQSLGERIWVPVEWDDAQIRKVVDEYKAERAGGASAPSRPIAPQPSVAEKARQNLARMGEDAAYVKQHAQTDGQIERNPNRLVRPTAYETGVDAASSTLGGLANGVAQIVTVPADALADATAEATYYAPMRIAARFSDEAKAKLEEAQANREYFPRTKMAEEASRDFKKTVNEVMGVRPNIINDVGGEANWVAGEMIAPGPEIAMEIRAAHAPAPFKPLERELDRRVYEAESMGIKDWRPNEEQSAKLLKYYDGALTEAQERAAREGQPFRLSEEQTKVALDRIADRKKEIAAKAAEEAGLNAENFNKAVDDLNPDDSLPHGNAWDASAPREIPNPAAVELDLERKGLKLTEEQRDTLYKKRVMPDLTDAQRKTVENGRLKQRYDAHPKSVYEDSPATILQDEAGDAVRDAVARPIMRGMEQSPSEVIRATGRKVAMAEKDAAQWTGRVAPFIEKMKRMTAEDQQLVIGFLDGTIDKDDLMRGGKANVVQVGVIMRKYFDHAAELGEKFLTSPTDELGNAFRFEPRENYVPHVGSVLDPKDPLSASVAREGYRKPGTVTAYVNQRMGNSNPVKGAEDLTAYFEKTYKEIAEKKHLGSLTENGKLLAQDAQIGAGIEKIKRAAIMSGATEYQTAKLVDSLKHITGGGDLGHPGLQKAADGLITLLSFVHLPFSAINNFVQVANTFAKFGMKDVATTWAKEMLNSAERGVAKYSGKANPGHLSMDEALRSGGPLSSMLHEIMGPAKGRLKNWVGAMLNNNGFTAAEKINRVTTVLSGMKWAEDLGQRALGKEVKGVKMSAEAAQKELERFGIRMDSLQRNGRLTSQQAEDVGYYFSERLQFGTSRKDLPIEWSRSPFGRVATVFLGFPLKQFYFVMDEIYKPLTHSLDKPLSQVNKREMAEAIGTLGKFAAAGIPLSMLANLVRDEIGGNTAIDKSFKERLGKTLTDLTATGFIEDEIRSFMSTGGSISVAQDDARAIGDAVKETWQKGLDREIAETQAGVSNVNDLIAKSPVLGAIQNRTDAGKVRQIRIEERKRKLKEKAARPAQRLLSRD